MADVDGALAALKALFGSGSAAVWPQRSFGATIPAVSDWTGELSDRAHTASNGLNTARETLAEANSAIGPLVEQAGQVSTKARRAIDAIRAQWQSDKAQLAPIADTPSGKIALLQRGRQRVAEATRVVTEAQSRFSDLARQVDSVTSTLPQHSDNGTTHLYDLPMAPPGGPFPLSPWEYNLDFTSDVEAGDFEHPGVTNAGQVTSVDDAWNELNRCFNCNFPMGGAPSKIPKVGDELPLEIRIAGQQLPMHFPVRVTQVEKTANDINIEFETLAGHVDGVDSTIHFRFYEQGGQLHLGIRGVIANGPGSEDIPILSPLERTGYTQVAKGVWQPYIDRLTRHVAEAKGLNTYGGR